MMYISKEILNEITNRCKGVFPDDEHGYNDWEKCILACNKSVKDGDRFVITCEDGKEEVVRNVLERLNYVKVEEV